MQASKTNKITGSNTKLYPDMQRKPHSCILSVPEHKFKSMLKYLKFNILHKVTSQRSSPFTINWPTESWGHREPRGMMENQSETLHHLHSNIPCDP